MSIEHRACGPRERTKDENNRAERINLTLASQRADTDEHSESNESNEHAGNHDRARTFTART